MQKTLILFWQSSESFASPKKLHGGGRRASKHEGSLAFVYSNFSFPTGTSIQLTVYSG